LTTKYPYKTLFLRKRSSSEHTGTAIRYSGVSRRLILYSDQVPPPPGVAVAARRMLEDPNDEPQYGDRIPYVIARGPPGTRLVDRAIAPNIMLANR
jgi:DNA polymerase elongation subunit (family B)